MKNLALKQNNQNKVKIDKTIKDTPLHFCYFLQGYQISCASPLFGLIHSVFHTLPSNSASFLSRPILSYGLKM